MSLQIIFSQGISGFSTHRPTIIVPQSRKEQDMIRSCIPKIHYRALPPYCQLYTTSLRSTIDNVLLRTSTELLNVCQPFLGMQSTKHAQDLTHSILFCDFYLNTTYDLSLYMWFQLAYLHVIMKGPKSPFAMTSTCQINFERFCNIVNKCVFFS